MEAEGDGVEIYENNVEWMIGMIASETFWICHLSLTKSAC